MSEPRPPEQERLWAILRAAEPPTGASARVREQIEATLDRDSLRHPHRRAIAVLASVGLAAAFLVVVIGLNRGETDRVKNADATDPGGASDPSDPSDARVLSASAATLGGKPLATGQAIPSGPVESGPVQIARNGRLRVALAKAEIDVTGPANIELRQRGLAIHSGRVEIQGSTWVAGPGCEAEVTGRAEVAVSENQTQITVFAGSVSAAPKQVTCKLIDLTPPGEKASPPARESRENPADEATQSRPETASPTSTDLAEETTGDSTAQTTHQGAAAGTTSQGTASKIAGDGTASKIAGDGTASKIAGDGTASKIAGDGTAGTNDRATEQQTTDQGAAAGTTGQGTAQQTARERTATGAGTRRAIRLGRGDSATSLLSRQVEAYRAADRLRDSDPTGALAAFETLQAAWPRSPLRHEIDLAIIDLLIRLGRVESARNRARQFLADHPDSPRRDHVSRIATQN
jgi:hypothetical protein